MDCNIENQDYKNNAMMVLTLLFPTSQIKFMPNELALMNKNGNG